MSVQIVKNTLNSLLKGMITVQSLLVTSCTNRFNIQGLSILPTMHCVFYLSQSQQRLYPIQQKLNGFYNRD